MSDLNIKIIFEDESIIVIDKPAGLVVNKDKSVKEETVQGWVENKFKIQSSKFKVQNIKLKTKNLKLETSIDWDEVNRRVFYERAGIVHRLDKETSGVLVIAKTEDVFVELLKQFREHQVKKRYLALAHGGFKETKGEIEAEVGRLPWSRERFGVLAGGRYAKTVYTVLKKFDKDKEVLSLVELEPLTGRTHQLRIHLKHVGHPIVGDVFYAGRKTARADRLWCSRLWLHAMSLELVHPVTEKRIKFESSLPAELQKWLDVLEIKDNVAI